MLNQPANAPDKSTNKPELLIAAVLHLMSHYTTRHTLSDDSHVCVKLAAVIERHLTILSELQDLGPVLRATCAQLAEQWTLVVERALPQQNKSNVMSRWSHGAQLN